MNKRKFNVKKKNDIKDITKLNISQYKYNDMLKDNCIDKLIMTGKNAYVKHKLHIKGNKKQPIYPHIINNGSPMYNCGERWTNWSNNNINRQENFIMNKKLDNDLNAFSINLSRCDFFVIDTDDNISEALVNKFYGHLPYTTSFSGKGRHYWARKSPEDIGSYKKEIKVKGNLDILYSDVLFETRINKNERVLVKNWNGDLSTIPTITIKELEEKLNFKMPSITTSKKQVRDKNRLLNSQLTRTYAKKRQIWGNPQMKIRFDIAKEILMALATNDYISKYKYEEWKKLIMAWFYQVPNSKNEEKFLDVFQEFTTKIFKFTTGDKLLEEWLEENIKLWGWCKANAYVPEGKHFRSTLWKILSDYNNKEFLRLASKDKGVVEDKVLNTIRDYNKLKEVFELWNYEVNGGECMFWEENKKLQTNTDRNMTNFIKRYRTITYDTLEEDEEGNMKRKTVSFTKKWLMDDDRRSYELQDFLPTSIEELNDVDVVNRLGIDAIKNQFEGLKADEMKDNPDINKKIMEMKEEGEEIYGDKYHHIRPILQHIFYLSGGKDRKQEQYLLKWLAHRVRYCGVMPKVALIFKSLQGVGKDMLFEWFGNDIIGSEYYTNTDDYDKILGRFNGGLEKLLLLCLNESSYGDTNKYENALKTLITDKKRKGEKKYRDEGDMRMCLGIVLFTNQEFVMNFQSGNRRFQFFCCEDKQIDVPNYFEDLDDCMKNEYNKALFVDYLYNEVEVDCLFDFKNNRVMNDYVRNLMRRSESMEFKFIRYLVDKFNEENLKDMKGGCVSMFDSMTTNKWYELYKVCCAEQQYKGTKNKENFTEDFINRHKLTKKMEIEQDEPQHINKFLIPTRGAKANKYKLKGERLAEFLIRQDNNMGYYEPEEQPTYISVRNEVVSDFVESEDDC
tara:strand:- start:41 stop:2746 length:2706 start_codon:yes stop_codon:yes gene_type:complete